MMEYTVQKLADLAGISARTLRYYDVIGILKPARINSSGYRIYGEAEVNKLQQILFYRELGLRLDSIKDIINSPSFDRLQALKDHHKNLLERRTQLNLLITNVEKSIASMEWGIKMSDKEKFAGFTQKIIEDNEKKYGEEIRKKYGDEAVDKANAKLMNMTAEQFAEMRELEEKVKATLAEAFKTGDPAGELAQKAAALHKKWLMFSWSEYSKEAHAGLAQMYVDDERFRAYYDEQQPGTAEFLRNAILIYTGMEKPCDN